MFKLSIEIESPFGGEGWKTRTEPIRCGELFCSNYVDYARYTVHLSFSPFFRWMRITHPSKVSSLERFFCVYVLYKLHLILLLSYLLAHLSSAIVLCAIPVGTRIDKLVGRYK